MRESKFVLFVATSALFVALFVGSRVVAETRAAARAESPVATLYVFTYRTPGVCPSCDRARPIARRLAAEYPTKFVYVEEDRELGARFNVDRFPTFVLVRRDAFGEEREFLRWSGCVELEARARKAFALLGVPPKSSRGK